MAWTAREISEAILTARLGSLRKDAQIDTCDVFAAALYDVLKARGVGCSLYVASYRPSWTSTPEWYHGIVRVGGVNYDSLGEFSLEIVRKRNKIPPRCESSIDYKKDRRQGFYDDEYDEMHAFYVRQLGKSFGRLPQAVDVPDEAEAVGFR